jgi:hypothetical protein
MASKSASRKRFSVILPAGAAACLLLSRHPRSADTALRRYGFMGASPLECAQIDVICEHVRDIKDAYSKTRVIKDEAEKKQASEKFYGTDLPEVSASMTAVEGAEPTRTGPQAARRDARRGRRAKRGARRAVGRRSRCSCSGRWRPSARARRTRTRCDTCDRTSTPSQERSTHGQKVSTGLGNCDRGR